MSLKLKLSYVCEKCEVKMVLVERYGKDNGIKNIFYSKIDHGFKCLKDHRCGKRHELKEGILYKNFEKIRNSNFCNKSEHKIRI